MSDTMNGTTNGTTNGTNDEARFLPIVEMFAKAGESIKSPRMWLKDFLPVNGDMVLKLATRSPASMGCVFVYAGGNYCGKINRQGRFLPKVDPPYQREWERLMFREIVAGLDRIAGDPAYAAQSNGRRVGKCACCRRTLTDPVSIDLGYGPVCAERFGLTRSRVNAARVKTQAPPIEPATAEPAIVEPATAEPIVEPAIVEPIVEPAIVEPSFGDRIDGFVLIPGRRFA